MKVVEVSVAQGKVHVQAPGAEVTVTSRRRRGAAAVATSYANVVATETLGASKMSVKERFDTLEERFLPEKAKGVDARWQFDLSGPGGGQWWVEIKGGKIKVQKGMGPGADVTLRATAENYLKIANDEVSGMKAFLTGMVKFEGDKGLAKKFKEYFSDPA